MKTSLIPVAQNVQRPDGDVVSQVQLGPSGGPTVLEINWSALIRDIAEKAFGVQTPPVRAVIGRAP